MSKRNSSAVARLKQDYIRLKKVSHLYILQPLTQTVPAPGPGPLHRGRAAALQHPGVALRGLGAGRLAVPRRALPRQARLPLRVPLQAAVHLHDHAQRPVQDGHAAVSLHLRLPPRHLEPGLVGQHHPHRPAQLHAREEPHPRLHRDQRLGEETVCHAVS